MADRRRVKKRKEEVTPKPTKQEYTIAKYIRGQLPQKKTTLFNHKVDYFVANKAINLLLDSPWAKSSKSQDAIFTTRESVVDYLDTMLLHNFFHRARMIPLSSKESKTGTGGGSKLLKKTDESSDEQDAKKKKKGNKKEDKKKPEEKKKRKFKLDMHLDQAFVDGSEVFVWIYEPTPWKAWIIGSFFVVGAILLCLFPLWPQNVRKGVYYLSIAAAGFLVVILALAVIRVVVFCIVWGISMGRHHLWLLPNLTEDVGFLESFWPIYKYDYRGALQSQLSDDKDETAGSGDTGKGDQNNKGEDEHANEEPKHETNNEKDNKIVEPLEGGKKRRRKRLKSKDEKDQEQIDDEDEDENGDEEDGAETNNESLKRPEDVTDDDDDTDTDRETSNDDDDKFEVLNADDVLESDNSDKPATR